MDYKQAMDGFEITSEIVDRARDYIKALNEATEAKNYLEVILTAEYLKDFRAVKKNLGYDMALLMMLEKAAEQDNDDILDAYKQYQTKTAEYKGLEKLINALETKVSYYQSLMRWQREGEIGKN